MSTRFSVGLKTIRTVVALLVLIAATSSGANRPAQTVESMASDSEAVVVGRFVKAGRRAPFCTISTFEVVKSIRGALKGQIEICGSSGLFESDAGQTRLVLVFLQWPHEGYISEFPKVWVVENERPLDVSQHDGDWWVTLVKGSGPVLSDIVPGKDTAADLSVREARVGEIEAALRERDAARSGRATLQLEEVTCSRRCPPETAFESVDLAGSVDCSVPGSSDLAAVRSCFAKNRTGPVHARIPLQGVDSALVGMVFRDRKARWHVVAHDNDTGGGGGTNPCLAAVFDSTCDASGLDERLVCKNRTRFETPCLEQRTRVLGLGELRPADEVRCERPSRRRVGCWNGGDAGTPLRPGDSISCRKAVFRMADFECTWQAEPFSPDPGDAGRTMMERTHKK